MNPTRDIIPLRIKKINHKAGWSRETEGRLCRE
jgi:hypothetical protein